MPTKYLGVGLAASLFASVALAQQGSPAATARISGTVIDSLRGQPMVGANVTVDGTMANAITDSLGHYQLTDVPPGRGQIAVYHPILDSLGVSLYTPPLAFRAGADTVVDIALPPPVAFMARICPSDTSARIVVIGHVRDADNDTPVANATVTEAGSATLPTPQQLVIRTGPVSRITKTDADGRFRLCLPRGVDYTTTATLGASATGQIPLLITNGAALPVLHLARADSAHQGNRGAVSGLVVSAAGKAVEGATVSLALGRTSTKTGPDGTFTLSNLPAGSQILDVRHVGFAESKVPVAVAAQAAGGRAIEITLQPKAAELPAVEVSAAAVSAAYKKTGFEQRKQSGWGQFLTADQINLRSASSATDLMQGIPGVRLIYPRAGSVRVVSSRGVGRNCTAFYVDGQPTYRGTSSDDEALPRATEIIGIEVYQANEPIMNWSNGPTRCLTVLIWTRASL
jgi:Carboxypeptidase regulatory-like domain/TonB-dependent Receptor Plug Domain